MRFYFSNDRIGKMLRRQVTTITGRHHCSWLIIFEQFKGLTVRLKPTFYDLSFQQATFADGCQLDCPRTEINT